MRADHAFIYFSSVDCKENENIILKKMCLAFFNDVQLIEIYIENSWT